MRFKKLFLVPALAALLMTSCGSDPAAGKSKIRFWGWGDKVEIEVFKNLVRNYNATNTDGIYVEYDVRPSSGYVDTMDKLLNQSKAPEIFYVGDGDIKRWATYGYLEDITPYVNNSEIIDLDDIWEEGVNRYRYDVATKTSTESAPLYCLPKDIGPTVIYYNVDAFKAVGIEIISKPANECSEEERHGFYKNSENKLVFNNRISMTTEEEVALAKELTQSYNSNSITKYGYYTEWWFNYVWSVGGDCLSRDPDGTLHWTLGDETQNGTTKNPLPSNREMFQHFIDLSDSSSPNALKIMPNPSRLSSDKKLFAFKNGEIAMLVGLRAHVPELRKSCTFDWDVAPLSHYEGGKLAGHSGSMGFGISSKASQDKKNAAFKFMEYLAGPEGQRATALSGFNLPNQKSIARTEDFLQTNLKPKNSIVFVEAAEYQTEGDWAYLKDNKWIDDWARDLNGPVLDGTMSLQDFFNKWQGPTDAFLNDPENGYRQQNL